MQTFNRALARFLLRRGHHQDEAFGRSSDPDELRNILATGGGMPVGQRAPGGPAGR